MNSETLKLSEDQMIANQEILEWFRTDEKMYGTYSLRGAAGTGKTTLLKVVIDELSDDYEVLCIAPTHKAKNVLKEKTGVDCHTMHGFLGYAPYINLESVDDFSGFKRERSTNAEHTDLVIVDEASMISSVLKKEIEEVAKQYKVKILYVGDEYQLPPIKEDRSPCLEVKGSRLDRIIRQANGNPLLVLLTAIRSDIHTLVYKHGSVDAMNDLWELVITTFPEQFHTDDIIDLKRACSKGAAFAFVGKRVQTFYNSKGEGFETITDTGLVRKLVTNYKDIKILNYTNLNVDRYNAGYRAYNGLNSKVYNVGEMLMSYTNIATSDGFVTLNNGIDYKIEDVIHTVGEYGWSVHRLKLKSMDTGYSLYFDVLDEREYDKYARYYVDLFRECKRIGGKAWKKVYKFKDDILLSFDLKSKYTSEPDFCKSKDGFELYCDYRFQFPTASIKYGYALTTHKSQGSTYERVLVNYNDLLIPARIGTTSGMITYLKLLYVALSRASKVAYIYKEPQKHGR